MFAVNQTTRTLLGDPNAAAVLDDVKNKLSLFESVHDFGSSGLPQDFVTNTEGVFYTKKRTIFNYLRGSFGLPENISVGYGQLTCHQTRVYTRSLIPRNTIEDVFLNWAVQWYGAGPYQQFNYDTVTYANFTGAFGPNLIFSIDSAVKLNTAVERLFRADNNNTFFQVLDAEKVNDPASHAIDHNTGMILLQETGAAVRNYADLPGFTDVRVNGFTGTSSTIRLTNGADSITSNPVVNRSTNHINCIPFVKNELTRILREANDTGNISIDPASVAFYNRIGGYLVLPYRNNLFNTFSKKRSGDQLQVLACKTSITYTILGQRTPYTVTHSIFASIDRLAIAFAILNGVNCIYVKGRQLFFFPSATRTTVNVGFNVVEINASKLLIPQPPAAAPRVGRGGGIQRGGRVDWGQHKAYIRSSPTVLLDIINYRNLGRFQERFQGIYSQIRNIRYLTEEGGRSTYSDYIRNESATPRNIFTDINNPAGRPVTEYPIFLRTHDDSDFISIHDAGNNMMIYVNNHDPPIDEFSIDSYAGVLAAMSSDQLDRIASIDESLRVEENQPVEALQIISLWRIFYIVAGVAGVAAAGVAAMQARYSSNQRAGGNEYQQAYSLVLAGHEITTLCDPEQKEGWNVKFYLVDDGIPFYHTNFPEIYAFFRCCLDETALDYRWLAKYLQFKKDAFAAGVSAGLNRIFFEMGLEFRQAAAEEGDIPEEQIELFDEVLVNAAALTKKHEAAFEGSPTEILKYMSKNDLTPLSFTHYYQRAYKNQVPAAPTKKQAPFYVKPKNLLAPGAPRKAPRAVKAGGRRTKKKIISKRRRTHRKNGASRSLV
uniref:Uncharacterized protein n=1 Tax=viral metagenome TaxID=1070528 RepID=A0A6C0BBL2_9ZZZZ